MKNITLFLTALLTFGLMSSVKISLISKTPPSSLESSTEFLGFLENGQYCYFRSTIINPGSYYTDKRCKEFVVRNANGTIIRTDTLWTEERKMTSDQKDNSIIPRKYKSTFNVFKYLSDNKVSTQENHWSYINLYNKANKSYAMLLLKLLNGDLYLYSDRNTQKDSILIYPKKENTKNIVAHLDNFLVEYEKLFTSQQEKPTPKMDIMKAYLSNEKPQIKAIYYQKRMFLVQLELKRGDDSGEDFDTYFTIPEDILEKALEKFPKK